MNEIYYWLILLCLSFIGGFIGAYIAVILSSKGIGIVGNSKKITIEKSIEEEIKSDKEPEEKKASNEEIEEKKVN